MDTICMDGEGDVDAVVDKNGYFVAFANPLRFKSYLEELCA
jgi:hypothetical protein